jgi:hypothetical protein
MVLAFLGWLAREPWKALGSDVDVTLSLSPSAFEVEAPRSYLSRRSFPIETIDRFQGDRRLSVIGRDGAIVPLAVGLPGRAHADLAARLNQVLEEVRHATYR